MSNKAINIFQTNKTIIRNVFRDICVKFNEFRFVLIVDEKSSIILASMFTTSELLIDLREDNKNVTVKGISFIEKYEKDRTAYPCYFALYFLHPDSDLSYFIKDMSVDNSKYLGAHLVCLYKSDKIYAQLKENKRIVEHLYTFRELALLTQPIGFNSFSCGITEDFRKLCNYSYTDEDLKIIERSLLSFLVSNKLKPCAYYYDNNENLKKILDRVYTNVSKLFGEYNPSDSSECEECVLVFIPREFDLIVPFMHRFTYEALLHENFTFEGDELSFDGNKYRINILTDEIYSEYCFKFISDCCTIRDKIKTLNAARSEYEEKKRDLKQPGFKKAFVNYLKSISNNYDSYALHLKLIKHLNENIVDKYKIVTLSEYENKCATKVDSDVGKPFKLVGDDVIEFSLDSGKKYRKKDIVQTLFVYHASGGTMPESTLKHVVERCSTGEHEESKLKRACRNLASFKQIENKHQHVYGVYTVDVYVPTVVKIAQAILNSDKLSKFGLVPLDKDRTSMLSMSNYGSKNIVFFFFGGVSYCELEKLHNLSVKHIKNKIYVGATSVVTADILIEELSNIG